MGGHFEWTEKEIAELADGSRSVARMTLRFLRPLAGGQPAGDKALEAFAEHHLKLVPGTQEFKDAIARIKTEEIGERDATPEVGEVQEKHVYAVNVIRRSDKGPYVLEHQVKALLKQAASRIGLFKARIGTKGDMAEMGTVAAIGESLRNPARPWEVYLRNGSGPATTSYDKIAGSVNTPRGKKSIQHHTEIAAEGSRISFEFRWPVGKLKAENLKEILAAAKIIGLGSCLSLGYGRFEVESVVGEEK